MIAYILLGLVFLLVYYLTSRNHNYWHSKGVPFEKPFLFFGSFYNVAARRQHIFHVIRKIYEKHNTPYVGIHAFTQPQLMLREPELIKRVLVRDFDKFADRNFAANEKSDPVSFNTLFAAKGAIWKNIRVKVSPVFTSGKMKMMFPLIKDCARNLNEYLSGHSGETVETKNVTKKYSVDVISSCAFGINAYCLQDEDSEILKMATKLLDFRSFVRSFSVFSFFFVPFLVNLFKLSFIDKTATNYLINVFKNTLREREERKIVRNDLIDLLNNLKKNEQFNEKYKFDDVKMAAQAISFFLAGNETTSTIIAFTLYELALHREIQDRLRAELNDSFDKYGDITYESIHDMKYLDMVFNESLRKYPLMTFLNRKTTSRYTFEDIGLTLDKDVPIIIPVVGLHYDPEYFPNPEKFDPERFSDEHHQNVKPYTFMPFGEGPRNCIGQRFGLMVSKIALAYTVKDFTFEITKKTSIPLDFNPGSFIVQNKDGIFLKVTKI